jgi:sigma-E factor negative regulatory protein RseB
MTWSDGLRCSAVSVLLFSGSVAAELSPHDWLDRMNEAVRYLDYEGRFVVQSGDQLDAMYLVHRVDGGVEKERMVSLTGQPREVIRSDEAVACLVSGQDRHINIERPPHDQPISPLSSVSSEELSQNYQMVATTGARVAGRKATQILIEPQDGFRFGYRLYVDEETALPLRSVVFDEDKRPVSQLMFVDITIGDGVTPVELDLASMQIARVDSPRKAAQGEVEKRSWRVSELPAGFRLSAHRTRPVEGGELEHSIYSDGLATFSVYVQPAGEQGLSGESRFGSSRAVGRVTDGYEIIVVGEVPAQTLRWVAERVVPSSP